MNQNIVAIIAGCNEDRKLFKCILYSNQFVPDKVIEKELNNEGDLNIIQSILKEKGFTSEVETIYASPELWESNKESFIAGAQKIAEDLERKQEVERAKAKDVLVKKASEVQNKAGAKNLKFYGAAALAIMVAAGITGYTLANHFNNNNVNATKLGKPAITTPVGPVDAKIAALKEQFAKGELNYDITNPAEAEKKLNILIEYSEKMQKNELTKSEIADLYLLSNGIKPIGDVNVGELVTKAAVAFAYDPAFDWEEISGQEVIANERDSEYLGMFLEVINDWKVAAESKDKEKAAEIGKKLLEMSIRSFQFNEPLNTANATIGAVKLQNISYSNQALLMCYVASTISQPGLNVNDIIKPVTIDGDKMTVMHLMKALSGPNVIPAGEDGRTDKGGEEGLINSIFMTLLNNLNQGNFAECPQDLKARIENLTKGQVKTLK